MNSLNLQLPVFQQLPSFFTPIWFSSLCKKNIPTSLSQFKYSNDDELKICRLFNYLVSMNDLTLLILNGMTRVRYTKKRNDISTFFCCFVPISIQDELRLNESFSMLPSDVNLSDVDSTFFYCKLSRYLICCKCIENEQ